MTARSNMSKAEANLPSSDDSDDFFYVLHFDAVSNGVKVVRIQNWLGQEEIDFEKASVLFGKNLIVIADS